MGGNPFLHKVFVILPIPLSNIFFEQIFFFSHFSCSSFLWNQSDPKFRTLRNVTQTENTQLVMLPNLCPFFRTGYISQKGQVLLAVGLHRLGCLWFPMMQIHSQFDLNNRENLMGLINRKEQQQGGLQMSWSRSHLISLWNCKLSSS